MLDEIFGQMDAICGGDGNGPAYDLYAISKTYFTQELEKIFENAMASDDFGFDILIDAQDCRTTDFDLAIVDGSDGSATGRATFKNMGEERIIDLVMTKSGEEWKVSDVVYRHRPFSLLARE
ncbi:hypothetical protein [Hyphomicrobium sp.]|uniref:hypothetical protein n=1 Tax=Hyphomicrobium sp. TaxID=82 RepID=UPI0025BDA80E|nr:hypothetical protein [Hyphomicrobium sp.]MCC7252883.1 hypothetical protein [Hyphomicrobium sp.]